MKVAVIGAGRVGLSIGAVLAARGGHEVGFIDRNLRALAACSEGHPPFEEPRLKELLKKLLERKSPPLRFAKSRKEALSLASKASFVFFTLSSPRDAPCRGAADSAGRRDAAAALSWVRALSRQASAPQIFVLKSSFPIGTFQAAEEICYSQPLVSLVVSPEFLRQGEAIDGLLHPDRLVIGSRSLEAAGRLASLYRSFCKGRVIYTSGETAELSKLVCNGALALSISFMNEMARLCAAFNGRFEDLSRIMAGDRRLRSWASFRPGLGFGGSCLPKDIRRLEAADRRASAARRGQASSSLLKAAMEANKRQPEFVFRQIQKRFQLAAGRQMAFYGLGFKEGTDDWTASPAIALAAKLLAAGLCLRVYDPFIKPRSRAAVLKELRSFSEGAEEASLGGSAVRSSPASRRSAAPPASAAQRASAALRASAAPAASLGANRGRLVFCSSFESSLRGAEGLATGTEASPPLSLEGIKKSRPKLVFIADGRGVFDPDKLRALGFRFTHPFVSS